MAFRNSHKNTEAVILTTQNKQSQEELEIMKASASVLADPGPLALGGFATTLTTFSLTMLGVRGMSTETIHVANLCFVAGIGLLVSGQWEMIRGNTFSYTVYSAYGLFYAGYGAALIPSFGIIDAYGGPTREYYNALGFLILIWAVFTMFFLLASLSTNMVYIGIFSTVGLCLTFDAASCFAAADGKQGLSEVFKKLAGVWGLLAGLLGYYALVHYLGESKDTLDLNLPMGSTSRYFKPRHDAARTHRRLSGIRSSDNRRGGENAEV